MSFSSDLFRQRNVSSVLIAFAVVGQTVALCYLWKSYTNARSQLASTEGALEKQTKLRAVERAGRISVQQAKRQTVVKKIESEGYNFHPIGVVESPFPDRRGTPRQPSLVPAARGKIRFNKKLIQSDHFKELSQFSHVWVLFVFHNNTNTEKEALAARIKPPRLHGTKVGCLSTRSPHRPNNIGLSVCEVIGVGPDFLELRCIDMVDGTPVLDGKTPCAFETNASSVVYCSICLPNSSALLRPLLTVFWL
jgi:tRNA-Thr(GGU) m(6)t(6)A37 methyltransferase TsaA